MAQDIDNIIKNNPHIATIKQETGYRKRYEIWINRNDMKLLISKLKYLQSSAGCTRTLSMTI